MLASGGQFDDSENVPDVIVVFVQVMLEGPSDYNTTTGNQYQYQATRNMF